MGETRRIFDLLVLGIRNFFKSAGFRTAFVGLSGGIDSTVVAYLAVEALGKDNVIGVNMPSRYSSEGSMKDAEELAQNLDIEFKKIHIESMFKEFEHTLEDEFKDMPQDKTEENMQARIRGMILMSLANKLGGLVLNTGNKTEAALGYCTLYGDTVGAISPISNVSKLGVYDLANHINADKEVIPKSIINRAPSAELNKDQTDEKTLGAPYEILSPLVDEIVDYGKPKTALIGDYPPELVDEVYMRIEKYKYKLRQMPPGIKI